MKQLIIIILLIITTTSCENSKNEENQIKVLQEAALKQFIKNTQIVEEIKSVVLSSVNIKEDEKYLSGIKGVLKKRAECLDLGYDSIIVKSKDKLNNYQKYLLSDETNRKLPILDNENNLDLWFQILMISEAEYNFLANNYASKIGISSMYLHFGKVFLYNFFAPDSIKSKESNYLIFKRVDTEFPEIKKYSLSKIRVFRNGVDINLPFEITKVDDVTIFRFTPALKGKYTIKVFQKCEEEFEWSIEWDKYITFDFEVH